MRERPILFSDEMVRAILAGRKTQTRRVVKHGGDPAACGTLIVTRGGQFTAALQVPGEDRPRVCPYGVVGDRLWVRECWAEFPSDRDVIYRANFDDSVTHTDGRPLREWLRWRPSIFMPRRASRITLELTDVRVQRLHDLTDEDAHAEGVAEWGHGVTWYEGKAREQFAALWERINGAGSSSANPWVWALTFSRVDDAAARAA